MRMKALVPAYGCKRTLAPEIVDQFGPHRSYWEPFCLSLAVLLAKEPSAYETANDLHGDAVNLARVLQVEALAEDLYRRAGRTLACERLVEDAKAHLRTPLGDRPDADRAYAYLVHSWLGINGTAGVPLGKTGAAAANYAHKGGTAPTRWRSVVDSIPAWHERLRHVQILSRDAFALLEKVEDAPGTVIYADPPYVEKGARYQHDFRSADTAAAFDAAVEAALAGDDPPDDHVRLSVRLRRFRRARVLVSYYDHPRVRRLYRGWSLLHCPTAKSLVNSGRKPRGRVDSKEVLLINGPATGFLPDGGEDVA